MTTPASYQPADPETVFTYGAPQLKFGAGASDEIGYDLSRHRRHAGAGRHRPGRGRDRAPAAGRRPDGRSSASRPRSSTARTSSRPTRACSAAIDYARDAGPVGRLRRRRRRLEHRHRQGGQPADHQPRRADGLRQRAGRQGPGAGEPAQAAGRRARPRPAPAPRARRSACSTCSSLKVKTGHQPRPAAADAGRRRPGADPDPAGRGDRGRRAWTSSATRWRATPRARTRRTSASSPSSGCPTAASNPIADMWSEKALSPARRRPSARAVHHGDDARGPRARWRWRRRSPAWASATPACTSRTPTPTRSPAGSRTSTPTATPPTSRWCRTACRSR